MATRFWGTLQWPALVAPRLPERIPDLKRPWLYLFELFWFACFALAVVGPVVGTWYRLTTPGENSKLMLGSRAGLVLSASDLTYVRFPVGSAAEAAGVEPGDKIVAIEGLPVARSVPLDPGKAVGPGHATDTDYALFQSILQNTQPIDLNLTLRSQSGQIRQFQVRTGEQHIDGAARSLHLTPAMLSIIDLFHILTYPFLLFVAWILHRRKREDLISSVLSLAVLLTMGNEEPSATFLTYVVHLPRSWHQHFYDLGNISLLAGILLFPHGQLKPRIVIPFLALLPLLFALNGDLYRLTFVIFMIAGVMTLLVRLRRMSQSAARQQIKWALLGFSGYALFVSIALTCDMTKLTVDSFGTQITLEVLAGLTFGLAFLSLQLGLLIALLRFRLYDAEVVIGRSVNVALITVVVAAIFQVILGYYGNAGGFTKPLIFTIALAAVVLNPLQEYIRGWSERRFRGNLILLRDELPDTVRDLRETASLGELIDEILARVVKGVRTTHIAAIIDQGVFRARGLSKEKVEEWQQQTPDWDCDNPDRHVRDKLFPVRIPLVPGQGEETLGFLLVGPRPDGSVISRDEQKALKEVAEPIGRAIRNVIRRVAYERRLESMIESSARRLDELEARINGPSVTAVPSSRSA